MKIASVLRQNSLRDLVPFGFQRAVWLLDQILSSLLFRVKCLFYGVEAGSGAKVWGKVCIQRFPGSAIQIGREVRIVSRPYRYALNIFPQSLLKTFLPSAKIILGDRVGFNSACIAARSKTIRIGNDTIIGGNCQIMDTDWHPLWPPEKRQHNPGDEHDQGVEIGSNVFIGLNCVILKGAKIGDNSVIGAGSVVTGIIPPNSLAAGVPARVLKTFEAGEKIPREMFARHEA